MTCPICGDTHRRMQWEAPHVECSNCGARYTPICRRCDGVAFVVEAREAVREAGQGVFVAVAECDVFE